MKEKLQLIYDTILDKIQPEEFDFSAFISKFKTEKDNQKLCGTVCCIAGWFPKYFPNAGFYFEPVSGGKPVFTHKSGKGVKDALETLLGGASTELVEYLFYGYQFPPKCNIEDFPKITQDSSLEEVKEAWKWAINNSGLFTLSEKYTLS